jgi:hypothetical protein
MALDVASLLPAMITAGQTLGGSIWNQMQTFAVPELQKIAIQIVAIEQNLNQFTPQGAQALLSMQVTATVGVIVAMTVLTLLDVQAAINTILQAVKSIVNQAIGFALIA